MINTFFNKKEGAAFTVLSSGSYHSLNDWHYHSSLEILFVIEGEGTLFIGDSVTQVKSNDLIVIGSNVPHMVKFDKFKFVFPLERQGKLPIPLALMTLHFDPEVLGEKFLSLSENEILNIFFLDALRGLIIHGETRQEACRQMFKLSHSAAHEKLPGLFSLLAAIAVSPEKDYLTPQQHRHVFNKTDEKRLSKVYLYTLENFRRTIKLKEIAAIIYMCPNAFCHYFKTRTSKSYFTFLLEVRIAHACKLLKENDFSIVVVCYDSGFTNLSNFNRHFKLLTGKTPLEYRKSFQRVSAS